jgi:hypothetical protein
MFIYQMGTGRVWHSSGLVGFLDPIPRGRVSLGPTFRHALFQAICPEAKKPKVPRDGGLSSHLPDGSHPLHCGSDSRSHSVIVRSPACNCHHRRDDSGCLTRRNERLSTRRHSRGTGCRGSTVASVCLEFHLWNFLRGIFRNRDRILRQAVYI